MSIPVSFVQPVPLFNKYGNLAPGITLVIFPDHSPLYTFEPVESFDKVLVQTLVPTPYLQVEAAGFGA